ncbi:carbohydrate kinase family protein [Wenzhouxiangella sp. AB-CW3]|uniref:carbohydrate kinase family protein n=1 Tax=Wenzhouxiangella sp. AB-CW3 TaxID=2771012 RepID=UPI00168AE6A5|nr:carbohydrate kinase family protein [Wenzhouxiangella sp. AB-CW3]QOC22790.1 carbohydrate kinase family protein [Wenzhouxiangella sp. AB-CW3]
MSVLICGSMAYDNIMVFPERFRDHILPDKTHMLNVAFLVPELHRNFGGCAGNIAYSLKKLGGEPLPMATVGPDFDDYARHLDRLGICQDYVRVLGNHWTAQAYITTDIDDNQITAFHPGAMSENHCQAVPTNAGVRFGIVSPDGKQAMLDHSEQFHAAGIPHVFDPGQGLPMFDADELRRMVDHADWLTVNSYEWELLKEKTGWSREDVTRRLPGGLIVTHGGEGSQLWHNGSEATIPAVKPERVVDPTGCGDAYRAGLLYGLERDWDPVDACRLGSLLGALKISHNGPQHHDFQAEQLLERFRAEFGSDMPPG